jgi:hypothetical protein
MSLISLDVTQSMWPAPGGRGSEPTPVEARFFRELDARVGGLDDWYHLAADGTLWMMVSCTFIADGQVVATLRLDYDGRSLGGGWSPANLNWDDGVRAIDAGIDTGPPDGLTADNVSCEESIDIAAEWFLAHIARRKR